MEIDPAADGEHHRAQDVSVTKPHPPASRFSKTMRPPTVVGIHTPVSLVSTYRDITNAAEMVDEENDDEEEEYGGEDMDYGGEYEDYDADYSEEDCVDGRIEPEMADGFISGEEDRKFRFKVWNEFIKIRAAGVVVKGQCKHCEAHITARRGVGTSAMRTHLKRCKVRKTVVNIASQLNATIMSPQGVALKDWRFNQEVSRRELLE